MLVSVENLTVKYRLSDGSNFNALKDLSLEINRGQIVGIVGESGAGKSTIGKVALGLLDENAVIGSGNIRLDNDDLTLFSEPDFENIRGKKIGYIYQNPMTALNPVLTIGEQLIETIHTHTNKTGQAARRFAVELLEQVEILDAEERLSKYPHQLSGGLCQRIVFAIAICSKPDLIIADEPTTALDVTVQKEILSLIKQQQKIHKMSVLFISHDLSVVAQFADRVLVMHEGKLVESGTVEDIFKNPQEPYTQGLLYARPQPDKRLERLPTVADFSQKQNTFKSISKASRAKRHKTLYSQKPLLEVRGLVKEYPLTRHWFQDNESLKALNEVSFDLYPGETLGLVGESGCGKSTISRALVHIDAPSAGDIHYKGRSIVGLNSKELRALRREIQLVFQDPFAALHPLKFIGDAIAEPLYVHELVSGKAAQKARVFQLLEQVGMGAEYYHRYPHQLSGGQRQRVVIARALATEPQLLLLDESVAALDISVQAQVLNLLNDLKEALQLSYLFISHDLNVVKYMADRILVMEKGVLVEEGEADELYFHPQEPYTQELISALPKI